MSLRVSTVRHDVGERDVLHRRVGRLLQGDGVVGVGDDLAVDADGDVLAGRRDGDRMRGGGLEYGAVGHVMGNAVVRP